MKEFIKYSRIPLAIGFSIALMDLPYGYYELLRTIATVLFIVYGIHEYKRKNKPWAIFWFGSALLVNPIFKIALGKILWNLMDVIWGIVLIYKDNFIVKTENYIKN